MKASLQATFESFKNQSISGYNEGERVKNTNGKTLYCNICVKKLMIEKIRELDMQILAKTKIKEWLNHALYRDFV